MTARRIARRQLLRTAFWSALGGGAAGTALSACRYAYPDAALRATLVTVPAADVPAPGADPLHLPREGVFVVTLRPGEGVAPPGARPTGRPPKAPGGVLVFRDRCTRWHQPPLRVVWWPQPPRSFPVELGGVFRCPCCQSMFTRAGLIVFGPAYWPLDTLGVRIRPDGSIVVHTKELRRGGPDNPERAVPLAEPRTERAASTGRA